jgi:hypothetical protein
VREPFGEVRSNVELSISVLAEPLLELVNLLQADVKGVSVVRV